MKKITTGSAKPGLMGQEKIVRAGSRFKDKAG